MARSGAAVSAPTFKYERPMDPATAMSKLEDIVDLFEGEVDITENEGPNQAMKATFYAKEVAGGLERAIRGFRMLHSSTADFIATCPEAGGFVDYAKAIQSTIRHSLAALGERP
jgi:hypothetical protein